MKTSEQINQEIADLILICADEKVKPNKKERSKNQIAQLRQYLKYLDSGATEEHLTRQHKELRDKLFKTMDQYETWKSLNPDFVEELIDESKLKAKFSTIMELKKLRKQIKAVKYLLN